MEELEQARYLIDRENRLSKGEGVRRTESYGKYGRMWSCFQEKLLARLNKARTENGHTWARRES